MKELLEPSHQSGGEYLNHMGIGGCDTEKVLKATAYVRVTLKHDEAGSPFVSKKYLAHSVDDQKRNAAYSLMALEFFKQNFADVLISPAPILEGASDGEILMEYLPELPIAQHLTYRTLRAADVFFRRCYSLEPHIPLVESIYDSVLLTPRLKSMIESGWPLRPGLKCDLFENLRVYKGKIILADVEGLAYEPYGLSELVLHATLYASLKDKSNPFQKKIPPRPIAFEGLSSREGEEICYAAIEVFFNSMKTVPWGIKKLKERIVENRFRKVWEKYYGEL